MEVKIANTYDSCIIGGGFFGCSLAVFLARKGQKVILFEMNNDLMQRASLTNQSRVHHGYHYPRHFLTALRSRANFPRFVEDYKDCIVSDFEKYYAIGRQFSKTNAEQFYNFMMRVGSPIAPADQLTTKLFNPELVEAVFAVREYAFDAQKLKNIAMTRLLEAKVEFKLNTEAKRILKVGNELQVDWTSASQLGSIQTKRVYNCTYSAINQLLDQSGIELIPLKHEVTEMCLIEVPDLLKNKAFTLMCGPFFSVMPYPTAGCHSLSHVRYTPHGHWQDTSSQYYFSPYSALNNVEKKTNFPAMLRDAVRFMPALRDSVYRRSLWEVKTTLPATEINDGRPILFKRNCGLPGVTAIMGAKIDNIYEVFAEIETQGE